MTPKKPGGSEAEGVDNRPLVTVNRQPILGGHLRATHLENM